MGAFDITRLQSEKPRSPRENGGRRIPKFQLKQATALVSDAQRHLTQSSVGLAQRSFMAALKVMDGAFGISEVDRLRAACQIGLAAAQSRRDLGGTSARGSTANPSPAAAHAPAGDKVAGLSRRADTASPLPSTAPPGANANGRGAVADGGKREGQAAGCNEDQALRGAPAGRLGPGPAALGDAEKGGLRGGGGVESRVRLDSAVPARGATRAGEGARRLDAHIARSPDAGQEGGPGDGKHRDPAAAAAAPSRSAERVARSQAPAEGGRASTGRCRRGRNAAGDAGAGAWERVGAKDVEPRTDLGQPSREQVRPSPPSACRRTDSGPRLRDSRPLCAASGPERRAAPRARAPPPLRRQVPRCARGPRAPLAHPLEAWCARHPAARAISQPPEPCACPVALARTRSPACGRDSRATAPAAPDSVPPVPRLGAPESGLLPPPGTDVLRVASAAPAAATPSTRVAGSARSAALLSTRRSSACMNDGPASGREGPASGRLGEGRGGASSRLGAPESGRASALPSGRSATPTAEELLASFREGPASGRDASVPSSRGCAPARARAGPRRAPRGVRILRGRAWLCARWRACGCRGASSRDVRPARLGRYLSPAPSVPGGGGRAAWRGPAKAARGAPATLGKTFGPRREAPLRQTQLREGVSTHRLRVGRPEIRPPASSSWVRESLRSLWADSGGVVVAAPRRVLARRPAARVPRVTARARGRRSSGKASLARAGTAPGVPQTASVRGKTRRRRPLRWPLHRRAVRCARRALRRRARARLGTAAPRAA